MTRVRGVKDDVGMHARRYLNTMYSIDICTVPGNVVFKSCMMGSLCTDFKYWHSIKPRSMCDCHMTSETIETMYDVITERIHVQQVQVPYTMRMRVDPMTNLTWL